MRKAQEISLNLIVVGALALLVLLIVGGILIFGGGNLFSGLQSMGPDSEQVSVTSFLSKCQSKCNTLQLSIRDLNSLTQNQRNLVKAYCCEHADLDGDGKYESFGDNGPEFCADAYDCKIGGTSLSSYCSDNDWNNGDGCSLAE